MADEQRYTPEEMAQAAREIGAISSRILGHLKSIGVAVGTPATWTGATRNAVLAQADQQRPKLTLLADRLIKGSDGLRELGLGVTDADQASSSGVHGSAPESGATPAPAPAQGSALTGEPMNFG